MKHIMNIWKGFLILLVFILCAVQVGRVQATYDIQHMIDVASDGGTVIIPIDTYYQSLTVNKNITLTGSGSTVTILHPASAGQRVISVGSGYNLTLNSLEVTGGQYDTGAGIYLAGGSLTLNSCLVDYNTATSYGGGVFQSGAGGSVTITDSVIDHNTATNFDGGGLYVSGSATLSNSNLTYNQASRHGGGMLVGGSTTQLTGGLVNNNQATTGNGGGVDMNNNLTINGTQFNDNSAGDSGGGLTQWNSAETVSITNAVFAHNSAVNKGGGAYLGSHATLTGITFSYNTVNSGGSGDAYGGGLYAPDGLAGSQLTFNANQALCGSCINADGGGLYMDRLAPGASSISSSTFNGNAASYGAGIYSTANDHLTVTDSSFSSNNSGGILYGGGVFTGWLEGDRLMFYNNFASISGGGMCATGHLVLEDSRFINNLARSSDDIYLDGSNFKGTNLLFIQNDLNSGALFFRGGTGELDFITIALPTLTATDTAIYLDDSSTLTLKDSLISSYGTGVNIDDAGTTVTEDYNLFKNTLNFNVPSGSTVIQGGHSIFNQDPHFVNPSAGDYHLRSNSPAIGKGTDLGVTTDLDGNARLGRWDIGAYQYWAFVYLPLILR